jgi:hypothetical protein
MKARHIGILIAVLAALATVAFVSSRWEARREPALCQICGRQISKQTEFRMTKADGVMLDACCARCAMHYMLDHPGTVKDAWATDYTSGRKIVAASAYYDEGGNVQYCTVHAPRVEREPEGMRVRTYDRCLPTLVAFATRDDAAAYQHEHGGRVLTYQEALDGVRSQ